MTPNKQEAGMQALRVIRGRIHTMDPARPLAQAMAYAGGRIIAIGTEDEVMRVVGASTPVATMTGACIVPGLIDSHNHMLATGMQRRLVDLSASRSIDDVLSAVHDYAQNHPEKPWIVGGQGWHIDALKEKRYPTRQELDSAVADRPVYLPRIYHAAAVNTLALRLAGLDTATEDPPGGRIVRDDHGIPTGVLHEAPAFGPIEAMLPQPSADEKKAALRAVQRDYLAVGICGVVEPGLLAQDMRVYEELAATEELTVRTVLMPLAQTERGQEAVIERLRAWSVRTGFGNARLKLGGIKVFLDGGASLGTALLREPYPGGECNCGVQVTDTETLEAIVKFCASEGWSLGIHTVGGRAIDLALAAFERASQEHDIRPLRFSLIHAYLWPTQENIATCARLGVAVATQASMQFKFASNLTRRFGRPAISVATPIRNWLDGGVVVAGGSDSPATPYDPLLGIWQATTRRIDEDGEPALGEDQAISIKQALALYTTNAAWLSFSDRERGSLEPGKLADWVELDRDLFECPPDEIRGIGIRRVVIDGEVVHDKETA
jgi:predicted amidohydrolase YtcJ